MHYKIKVSFYRSFNMRQDLEKTGTKEKNKMNGY